tara:strand:+ start:10153 stop:10986 length:834 start_codon:yes stop_codon:yes gene_type:complete
METDKPDTGVFDNGKFKLRLNQTIIKALSNFNMAEPSFCPSQVRQCNFSDSPCESIPTDAMRKGIVFETLALDLPESERSTIPLLKNGNVSADYERVIKQAAKFKEMKKEHEIMIYERQQLIEVPYSDEITIFGTLDFVSTFRENETTFHPKAIVDLKLTGNVFNTFGDFSWAFPFNMDHTQAFMYTMLYKMAFNEDLPFFYMVYDYSPSMNMKIFKKKVGSMEIAQLHESIRKSVEKIRYFDENGWIEIPEYKRCQTCPVNSTCASFTNKQKIEII